MRAPDRRLPCPGLVGESSGAQDGPLEGGALCEVLVRLVLPVHVGGDGLAHALGHGDVGVVLGGGGMVLAFEGRGRDDLIGQRREVEVVDKKQKNMKVTRT